ncbi:hypothetical protein ACQ4M3_16600 [Leptolyngbya sp. AN03gr2]|uniref:hypothetical protein n=1 Tax=unclassified Leptolyngbya TaxID=2650499 RepID=UPI003D312F3A
MLQVLCQNQRTHPRSELAAQMNSADLRTKLLEEIRRTPDDQLVQLYQVIQTFKSHPNSDAALDPMSFAGCWADLPDNVYQDLLDEIGDRRQTAFSERHDREIRFNPALLW